MRKPCIDLAEFVLAESQNLAVLFPVSALTRVVAYGERVAPCEEKPIGEEPISGAVAHELELLLPETFRPILEAVESANAAGKVLVGFARKLSGQRVTIQAWRCPRVGFDADQGYLGMVTVRPDADGTAEIRAFLEQAAA